MKSVYFGNIIVAYYATNCEALSDPKPLYWLGADIGAARNGESSFKRFIMSIDQILKRALVAREEQAQVIGLHRMDSADYDETV